MSFWHTGKGCLKPTAGFGLMGILNLTPDSFYDGGRHNSVCLALSHAERLVATGADVLDLGAESSRPGSLEIAESEEIARLVPALAAIRGRFPLLPVSVDTWRGNVAAQALDCGAWIINDIGSCSRDPSLMDVLAQYKPGYVLMHSRGLPRHMQDRPAYRDVVGEVKEFFARNMAMLVNGGLPEENIVLDPGIGFGKSLRHNLELLAGLREFLEFGRPLLVGVSMKSMFGQLLDQPVTGRGTSTAVASALLWQKGVFWHRVHDVDTVRKALLLARSLACPDSWEESRNEKRQKA